MTGREQRIIKTKKTNKTKQRLRASQEDGYRDTQEVEGRDTLV